MSGRSSSANGGWLAYLEQLSPAACPPCSRRRVHVGRRILFVARITEKRSLPRHMGITKKQMEALAQERRPGRPPLEINQARACHERHRSMAGGDATIQHERPY